MVSSSFITRYLIRFHVSAFALIRDLAEEDQTSGTIRTNFYYLLYCYHKQSSELKSGNYYAQDSLYLCRFGQCPGELTT